MEGRPGSGFRWGPVWAAWEMWLHCVQCRVGLTAGSWECGDKDVWFVERAQAKLGRRRCGRLSQSGFRRGAVWGSLGFVVAACVVARRFDCRFMEVC